MADPRELLELSAPSTIFFQEAMQINEGMMPGAVGAIDNSVDALRFGMGLAEALESERENPDSHYKYSFATAELALAIAAHYDVNSGDARMKASEIWEPALRAMDTLQELIRQGYGIDRARELAMPPDESAEGINPLSVESRARDDFCEMFSPTIVASAIELHDLAQPPPRGRYFLA